jgi:hypothetical protein
MFRKKYVGHHGYTTFVQGVWVIDGDEYFVRVTATGRTDDEFVVGEVYSLEEVAGITNGDVYAYADLAETYAAA